jgi:hypothetical protein
MLMINTASPQLTPLAQRRRRLGGRRRLLAAPRPAAALGYLADGPVFQDLIEIERLTLVILYDEPEPTGRIALRLAGYAATRVPWGVRFGGPGECRFFKDLALQPVPAGGGYRLNLTRPDVLRLGLKLERQLNRRVRYCPGPMPAQPRLPKLWAGFSAAAAAEIRGDGPELFDYVRHTGQRPEELMARLRRHHAGLVLYPLAWVSHHWQEALTVLVDLAGFPPTQVFALDQLPGSLFGFQGAAEVDLFHSRFRQQAVQPQSASMLDVG